MSNLLKLRLALLLALSTALAAVALGTSPAGAAAVPEGAVWTEQFFPSVDGTMLNAEVLLLEQGCGVGGCPAIVSIGPYYGQGSQDFPAYNPANVGPSGRFHDFIAHEFPGRGNIFEQGYAWIAVDSRGYGESGGCNDYGGAGEQMDAYAAVEWAATQEWSSGKVGMWGTSYDAWTQVMALDENPPHLEAVIIQAPIIEGYGIAYVNGVHHDAGWYSTTALYQGYDYTPTALPDATPEEIIHPTVGTATNNCWANQHREIALGWDHDEPYWQARDLRPKASADTDVAVFWVHGFNDVNTKPDQIFGVYDGLTASPEGPVRGWFGQWAHDRGNESPVGRDGFLEEAMDWLDHYLKGLPFRYEANARNVVEVQDQEGDWRTEAVYPPSDAVPFDIPLNGGTYVDDGAATGNGFVTGGPVAVDANAGIWTFSAELPHDIRVVHEPTLTVTADIEGDYANLVGVLYDYAPNGTATEISRGAFRLEEDGTVSFRLHPRDHVLREGNRLAFHITGEHPEFFPHSTGDTVTITAATVTPQVLTYERDINLEGGPSSRRAYTLRPSAATVAANTVEDLPLPPAPVPYPDAETREAIQPTVTTGSDAVE